MKEEEVVKLLYPDVSCGAMARSASKARGSHAPLTVQFGELAKQGGSDKKKWASRYVALCDTFLLYYAGKSDKHAKV